MAQKLTNTVDSVKVPECGVIFCSYKDSSVGYCGLVATHGDRCKRHVGKEITERKKAKKFRGDSQWQIEQGLGISREGSNA